MTETANKTAKHTTTVKSKLRAKQIYVRCDRGDTNETPIRLSAKAINALGVYAEEVNRLMREAHPNNAECWQIACITFDGSIQPEFTWGGSIEDVDFDHDQSRVIVESPTTKAVPHD